MELKLNLDERISEAQKNTKYLYHCHYFFLTWQHCHILFVLVESADVLKLYVEVVLQLHGLERTSLLLLIVLIFICFIFAFVVFAVTY